MDRSKHWVGPDFVIVGAPKCATTSLYGFLKKCPDVFMTEPKEPNYYSRDLHGFAAVATPEAYRALYKEANAESICGEASVWYLLSTVAAKNILAENSEAKIIASLRNPIDASIAWYHQMRVSLREDRATFEESWRLQNARSQGQFLPFNMREPVQYQYRSIYSYSIQIE